MEIQLSLYKIPKTWKYHASPIEIFDACTFSKQKSGKPAYRLPAFVPQILTRNKRINNH